MPQPTAPHGGTHVKTTARESMLYQAGYEAGQKNGYIAAAADAGAASAQLAGIRLSVAKVAPVIEQALIALGDPAGGKKRKAFDQLRAAAAQAIMVTDAARAAYESSDRQAQSHAKSLQEAQTRFAELISSAIALTPPPPSRLRRLLGTLLSP